MPSSDTGYSATVMTKAQFMAQVAQVRSCSASLASARDEEYEWEAMTLRHQINILLYAKPARKNPQLEAVRRSAVQRATDLLSRRCA